MSGQTPIYGFPYPDDTDPVYQGAKHMRDLANQLESTFDQHGQYPASSDLQSLVARVNTLEAATKAERIDLKVESGHEEQPTLTPHLIRVGRIVYLNGGFSKKGLDKSGNIHVATIPDGFRPTTGAYGSAVSSTTSTTSDCSIYVGTNGKVNVRKGSKTGDYYLAASGFAWAIDD